MSYEVCNYFLVFFLFSRFHPFSSSLAASSHFPFSIFYFPFPIYHLPFLIYYFPFPFSFSELPPPPENVRASDVERTEAVITWSHPELYQMYSINGYSLQIRQFGTNTWLHFTSTPGENHRITNLDPDTAYFVRLKSKNEYGMGEPSTNGELKTKKGWSFRLFCEF